MPEGSKGNISVVKAIMDKKEQDYKESSFLS